ncbi:hypothetical protein SCP_0111860 [Sparassis crispa]|uniref:Uncharacterized protein n=1 Tax=Sparassis crispa TaxID=139825 RepID=A0A401G815_9APHY|nr:hypothetical protein SCP_0111860 [Sparassis crispa]GBE78302.1 hypothetical protein SCP_0111860 [Sparassis crispa]
MVDLNNLRSQTPSRSSSRRVQASRITSSEPPAGPKRSGLLDSVDLSSLKRKRPASQKAEHVAPTSTRTLRARSSQHKPSETSKRSGSATANTSTATPAKGASSSANKPKRKRARTASPSLLPAKEVPQKPTRKSTGTAPARPKDHTTNTGLLTPAWSAEFQSSATTNLSQGEKNVKGLRAPLASLPSKSIDKGKGKGKAREVENQAGPSADEDNDIHGSQRTEQTASARGTKRRKISSPAISLPGSPSQACSSPEIDAEDADSDLSFHMLDIPEVAALPWLPQEPSSPVRASGGPEASLYVPPGVLHLIENMKHALAMETTARHNAEARYAEEVRRRLDAECAAAELAEENRLLEREAKAWSSAAAETFADAFAQAFATSVSPARTGDADAATAAQHALRDIEQAIALAFPLNAESLVAALVPALTLTEGKGKGKVRDVERDTRELSPSVTEEPAATLERPTLSRASPRQMPSASVPSRSGGS